MSCMMSVSVSSRTSVQARRPPRDRRLLHRLLVAELDPRLPDRLLKIDKSFLGSGEGEAAVPALTAAILELASILDLRPVAEGIETSAQLARLRELGCSLGQGYLFAKPMTAAEVRRFAAARPQALPAA
jgi:sensor c-di-GMP phosphodiesterase-like protein